MKISFTTKTGSKVIDFSKASSAIKGAGTSIANGTRRVNTSIKKSVAHSLESVADAVKPHQYDELLSAEEAKKQAEIRLESEIKALKEKKANL